MSQILIVQSPLPDIRISLSSQNINDSTLSSCPYNLPIFWQELQSQNKIFESEPPVAKILLLSEIETEFNESLCPIELYIHY